MIDVEDLDNIICESCNHDIFIKAFVIKRVSSLLTGEQKDREIEIAIRKCDSCGHISDKYSKVRTIKDV